MDQCACGNEKSVYEFECAECKAREEAEFANRVAWISAEKAARDGNYGPLNDLIDNQ